MADARPNIVFILHDNTGWGDWGVYGGNVATPRIDKFASEGIRFNNYTVEAQCTPTRSAIMTGRQPSRTGCFAVPMPGTGSYGLAPWEYTIAELLSDTGYATGAYGKWHLGEVEGRLPIDHGFDEWWGEKNTTDECGYNTYALFRELVKAGKLEQPKVWAGTKGEQPTAVADLDMEIRPLLDEQITEKATDFIKRQAKAGTPFFAYVAFTHFHPPEAVHPDFDQTDPARLGAYADIIAEQDYRTGQILDALDAAGVTDNTLVVVTTDNAAAGAGLELSDVSGGSNGPWRGNFFTIPYEGCYRVPAMVRWPGKVPAGVVSEELLSGYDWYRTFATLAGAADKVPTDRPIDGVDASQYLLGKAMSTGREYVLLVGPDGEPCSVKYGNLKFVLRYSDGIPQGFVKPQFPFVYDLGSDPSETTNLFMTKMDMAWMFKLMVKALIEYKLSIAEYPNVKPGEDFKGYHGLKQKIREHKVEQKEEEMHFHAAG